MQTVGSTTSLQKHVVLLGAGNAHLRFVRMFGMRPVPGLAVTLVSEAPVIPYSAMVPGYIGGDYVRAEITIDLIRLCRHMGCRFLAAQAVQLDVERRLIKFEQRPELAYDVVSLGVGSTPYRPAGLEGENSWLMRPLGLLLDRLDELERRLRETEVPFHLCVVGGGASGCELSLAIRRRLATIPSFRLTLLQANERLLPGFSSRISRIFERRLSQLGVTVQLSSRVIGGNQHQLLLEDGTSIEYDAVLWATHGGSPSLVRSSGVQQTEDGFLLVRDTLQSVSHPEVFGTGDCIELQHHGKIAKNGVHAVRQGGVLFDNVLRFLQEKPLRVWKPQRYCLCLLNTGAGTAALSYGGFATSGRWPRKLKDWIDRAWVQKFTAFPSMGADSVDETSAMRCGGCGSKISSEVLTSVLRRLNPGYDSRVLIGTQSGEDAAIHRFRPELFGHRTEQLVEVQTVDYFKSFLDDYYLQGKMAALHALSDLFAMNARPFAALAIVTLPFARGPIQESMLYELLSGAIEVFKEHGVTLTGGHTTEGSELAVGFAVTGHTEEDRLLLKSNLRPGDVLILTKPLGTGAILAAWMRGVCPAFWFTQAVEQMLQSNRRAAELIAQAGVRACTDVTGFGLAGHLLEMLDASRVSARLLRQAIPVLNGFDWIVQQGITSSLHPDNLKQACRIAGITDRDFALFDPQTSGGLLFGVEARQAPHLLAELRIEGYRDASIIGEVRASTDSSIFPIEIN